jgi:hypothetical protein
MSYHQPKQLPVAYTIVQTEKIPATLLPINVTADITVSSVAPITMLFQID